MNEKPPKHRAEPTGKQKIAEATEFFTDAFKPQYSTGCDGVVHEFSADARGAYEYVGEVYGEEVAARALLNWRPADRHIIIN